MATDNRVCRLFGIQYPIIQAGMIWCSGAALASAVSNAGGLGLLGAGSMYPQQLRDAIRQCKAATDKPFGVNLPLLYPDIDQHIRVIEEEGVKIVFTSAGNPKTWTSHLKALGITVVHVVSSVKFALKAEAAGVDAVVSEGFEAGGHNGREEITTFVLIPATREAIKIPLIAAGGVGTGRAMLGALALGADGVQVGTRFALTQESSGHLAFKQAAIGSAEGDTQVRLKQLTPVRLLTNPFSQQVEAAELRGSTPAQLLELLGRARAKLGMAEGDLQNGELEIGQVAAYINDLPPAAEVVRTMMAEYRAGLEEIWGG